MLRQSFVSSVLVALVSVPGFLVGQKLRQGDSSGLLLVLVLAIVVLLASAIMRMGDGEAERSPRRLAD